MCIRYVVSYPRLSRMTRRNGTGYLRFWALDADAVFRAGALAAPRRGAAALPLAGRALETGVGAARRAAVFGRAAGVGAFEARAGCGSRAARTGFGSTTGRGRGSGAALADRCTAVNRI